MLTLAELTSLSRNRLEDAEALLSAGRYDGAVYVCGYAVEIALKARIVRTLKWPGFAPKGSFKGFDSFKTHDLEPLLYLSGWQTRIMGKASRYRKHWLEVNEWNPESRYRQSNFTLTEATKKIDSARIIVGAVL
jgi:HEPN domain-containing protein